MSIRATIKKRGRPATGKGEPVQVRLQPDLLEAVDAYAATLDRSLSRPDAIRLALRDWLTSHGFLAPAPLDHAETEAKIAALDAHADTLKHDGSKSPANAMKTMDKALVKAKASGLRKRLAGTKVKAT